MQALPFLAHTGLIYRILTDVYAVCLSVRAAEAALHDAESKRRAAEEELFIKLPDRVVSSTNFEEKSFGYSDPSGQKNYPSANEARDLSSIVVSLALFDRDCATLCLCIFLIVFSCHFKWFGS